jgi:intraflagellar transport protein 57
MAHKHAHEVSEVLPSSRALFESLHQQLVGELDALSAREAALNDQFESARMRYKDAREEHDGGRSRLHGEAENLTRTKNDLSRCEEQLEEIRTQLEEHGKGGSSSSGVMMKTKQAIRQLEEEMRQMDVRMGVLESTVLKKMLQRHEAPVAV